MFEVYLNDKRDLLVVKKGSPLPLIGESGKWRIKRKVLRVSDEIRSAVQKHGYYVRKLSGAKCPFRNFLNRVNRLDSMEVTRFGEGSAMWTLENRLKYNRDHLRYPSDLTDD